ncbi:MAG: NosD domain-containing protein [Promethearchaeota archaeon]
MYKKLKNKKITFIFGVILLITLNLTTIPSVITPMRKSSNEINELKSSGIYYDIVIDDLPSSLTNWTWAMTQPWFGGGSGTSGDPYRIENHIFEYNTGSGLPFGIINSRKYFIINNCTFRNSASGNVALLLSNVTNGQILNSYIYNSGVDGINVDDTNEILISNNEIYDNAWSGIYMHGVSENNTIIGNLFYNNGWYGTEIYSNNNLFYDNYFVNPISGHAFDTGTNDWNNTVIGNYWSDYTGYDMDLDGIGDTPYDVPPGGGSQDYLPIWNIQTPIAINDLPSSPTNWLWAQTQPWFGGGSGTSGDPYILENFKIDGGGTSSGIIVENSDKHFIIRDSNLYNSGGAFNGGIALNNVTNAQIIGNNASSNTIIGIFLMLCDYITISGNIGILNQFGIVLWGSNHTTISGNTFNTNSMDGIYLLMSALNSIIGNTMSNNVANGTYLLQSDFNTISGNTINNNDIGLGLDSGSNDNLCYENYFRNSGTDHAFDNGVNNDWNNTLIGNYWDDYTGYDMDFDGIGDTPHDVPPPGGSQDYLPIWNLQGPISIDDLPSSMNNWAWAVSQAWCSGSGTVGDPYIIENLNIDSKNTANCIEILNSRAFFEIRNCECYSQPIGSSYNGVYLENVTNGALLNNDIHNNYQGMHLVDVNYTNIINNDIYNSAWYGMFVEDCNHLQISLNNFSDNAYRAIRVDRSNYNTISNNYIYNTINYDSILLYTNSNFNSVLDNIIDTTGDVGIRLLSLCNNNTVSGNEIMNSNDHGISVEGSNFNILWGNIIHDNDDDGIRVTSSDDNTFYENVIRDNIVHGIYLDGTSERNLFYRNFLGGNTIHAFDDGSNNDWNTTIIGNYWDNWTSPDSEPDGIVDAPYTYIKGSANSIDYLPIAEDGPPSITINSPSTDDVFGASAPGFSVTITDDFLNETWYTIDGGLHNFTFTGSTGTIDQSAWDAASDGAITLTFYALDYAENIGSAVVNIEKDTQEPSITITSPSTDDTFVGAPSFVVEITDDNLDSMWYSLDGGITTFTFDTNGTIDSSAWAALATGSVTITFYANDTAGNLASESVNVIKVPPASGDMIIIIIIIVSAVAGAAVVTIIIILRKRKAGEE